MRIKTNVHLTTKLQRHFILNKEKHVKLNRELTRCTNLRSKRSVVVVHSTMFGMVILLFLMSLEQFYLFIYAKRITIAFVEKIVGFNKVVEV